MNAGNDKFEMQAMDFLENERYQEFDFLLENSELKKINPRLCSHLRAKKFLFKENYKKALLQLQLAQETYGHYIGIKLDILTCYYFTRNFFHLEESLKQITQELTHFSGKISKRNLSRTYLFIGKMHEELCQLSEAQECYELALQYAFDIEQKINVTASLLRFCSLYNKSNVALHFARLEGINDELINNHLYIDVLHAKTLARFELLDFKEAFLFLKKMLDMKLNKSDRALIYYDALEIILRSNNPERNVLMQEIIVMPTNEFEENIFNMSNGIKNLCKLNKAEKLRLLYHAKDKGEYYLLLQSLTSINLKLWSRAFITNSLELNVDKIEFYQDTVSYKNKTFNLSKKNKMCEFINLFKFQNKIICNELNYDQLRMISTRLNKLLLAHLGIGPCFKLQGREIILNLAWGFV